MATVKELEDKALASVPEKSGSIVNGDCVDVAGAHRLPIVNPDNGKPFCHLAEAEASTVETAAAAARAAFEAGAWSRTSIEKRQAVLYRAADFIDAHAEEIALLDALSTGLLFGAMVGQAHAGAAWFRYFANLIGNTSDQVFQQLPNAKTIVTREAVGVAGLFTPWNIPVMGASLKLSAALAMGNSCVIKPSEQSPLGTVRLVELLHEAGVPTDVLHLVNGRGAVTGAALAASSDIDLISFTGGENAGRIIAREAAKRFAKVTMELGGKSANIVFADADYDRALDGSLLAIFANNGQACLAGSRILVHKKIADRFIADFVARGQSIKVGRPFDPNTELGPQSSAQQMARVLSFAEGASEDGCEILTGGDRATGIGDGYYVNPTVALAKSNGVRICQEEIFGPFATFLTFEDDEDAVNIANDTRFGLAAYLWTERLERAVTVGDRLRAGTVLINTPMLRERNAPFGGFGHSGIDREGGRWSLDFYSEAKATVMSDGRAPIPQMGKGKRKQ
ncbi:MAG: aldehyde dehydrogenase family protein [Pseudomonadota bacterium]